MVSLLREHLQQNLVRIGRRWHRQKQGIPQVGSCPECRLASHEAVGMMAKQCDDQYLQTDACPAVKEPASCLPAGTTLLQEPVSYCRQEKRHILLVSVFAPLLTNQDCSADQQGLFTQSPVLLRFHWQCVETINCPPTICWQASLSWPCRAPP